MKLAPLLWTSPKHTVNNILNTGQHYDPEMSSNFINEFKLPLPDWTISPPKHDSGQQFLKMIQDISEIIKLHKFDYVFVYGDTNSTLAATISATKHGLQVVHIESGLRSRDFNMPEERNRIIVDTFSRVKFTPTLNALDNLKDEDLQEHSFFVGDLMLDLFVKFNKLVSKISSPEEYILCTIHRKSNLEETRIKKIIESLNSSKIRVKLLIHPALKSTLENVGNISYGKMIQEVQPQSYINTLKLLKNAKGVITDSGGLQKEAYWMGKPTLIARTSTEWPETTEQNSHKLDFDLAEMGSFTEGENKQNRNFDAFGNGESAMKIWDFMLRY
jgi:UDP-GlcNAc3NAcA epimerase